MKDQGSMMERARYYESNYLERDAVGFEENIVIPIKVSYIMSILRNKLDAKVKPQVIMEIGCGEGHLSGAIQRNYPTSLLIDLDLSHRALARAGSLLEGGTFLQADAEAIPVRSDSLDLILLVDVLEHLPDPLPAMREALRAARYVLLKVPLEKNLWGLGYIRILRPMIKLIRSLKGTEKRRENDFFDPHLRRFTAAGVMRLVDRAHGEVVACRHTGYPRDPDFDEILEGVKMRMYRESGLLNKLPRHYMFFQSFPFPCLRMFVKRCVGRISPNLYAVCFHTQLYVLLERRTASVET